ncbi:hypothetical protein FJU08_15960 [Martelella alba]|uniref:Uncharacterized protein n=1 Tax=Martelella alba TaxID=2590451 RepID=A0A506U370_9HYPH|nr:hypothetical protein [Martelella alba]TPW28822.1 hypothetical protein FJU08_15960 [Martelella alba]
MSYSYKIAALSAAATIFVCQAGAVFAMSPVGQAMQLSVADGLHTRVQSGPPGPCGDAPLPPCNAETDDTLPPVDGVDVKEDDDDGDMPGEPEGTLLKEVEQTPQAQTLEKNLQDTEKKDGN